VAKWKKWAKELAVMAVVMLIAASAIGYLRAPSYDDAALPSVQVSKLYGMAYDSTEKPDKPYVLHFWATWCPVCRAEAANIDALARDAKVITVAVKSGGLDEIHNYMRENGLSFPVVNDQNGDCDPVQNNCLPDDDYRRQGRESLLGRERLYDDVGAEVPAVAGSTF